MPCVVLARHKITTYFPGVPEHPILFDHQLVGIHPDEMLWLSTVSVDLPWQSAGISVT